jgi:hypothetical protein
MAQRFSCPHKGQRHGSTVEQTFMARVEAVKLQIEGVQAKRL